MYWTLDIGFKTKVVSWLRTFSPWPSWIGILINSDSLHIVDGVCHYLSGDWALCMKLSLMQEAFFVYSNFGFLNFGILTL